MARMVSTEVWDTVNSVIGCLNFKWCCDEHIHGLEHLITCLWAAIELVYLWMEPGGTSLAPSPRYPAEKSWPQTHFEENDILCLGKKTFNGKRNVVRVFTKNLSEWCETVKWYGNMNCLFHAWLDTLPVLPSNVSLNLIQNLDFMFIYSQVLYQSILLLYTIPSPTPFSCTSRPWRWDNTRPEQAGRQCWVGILLVS